VGPRGGESNDSSGDADSCVRCAYATRGKSHRLGRLLFKGMKTWEYARGSDANDRIHDKEPHPQFSHSAHREKKIARAINFSLMLRTNAAKRSKTKPCEFRLFNGLAGTSEPLPDGAPASYIFNILPRLPCAIKAALIPSLSVPSSKQVCLTMAS
jgi:hypothetical protein